MRLPLSNAAVSAVKGYNLTDNKRYNTLYSYTKGSDVMASSAHQIIKTNGDNVYSNGTSLALKTIEMIMSEITNWGEFTPYTSLTVLDENGEIIQIRPIVLDKNVVLSAYNTISGEEKTICSYGITTETGALPSGLSFYLNIGTITLNPTTDLYTCNCTAYAIINQSGCGFDGIGGITLAFDKQEQSYQNQKYKVTEVIERKTL